MIRCLTPIKPAKDYIDDYVTHIFMGVLMPKIPNIQVLPLDQAKTPVHKFGKIIVLEKDTPLVPAVIKIAEITARTILKKQPQLVYVKCSLDSKGAIYTSGLERGQTRLFARIWIPI